LLHVIVNNIIEQTNVIGVSRINDSLYPLSLYSVYLALS